MLSKTSTQRTYCRPSSVSRGGIGYPDHQKTLTLPGGERRRGPVLGCLQGGPTKLEGSSRHNRRTQQEWGPYNPGNPSCSPSPVRTGWHHGHSVPDERTRKNQGRNLAVWLFYPGTAAGSPKRAQSLLRNRAQYHCCSSDGSALRLPR